MTPRTTGLCRPSLECLEDRTVPYSLSGYKWANPNVTASFVPDGTAVAGGYASTLNGLYNAKYQTPAWQREFARALQTWSMVTPLNFHFVADGGQAAGTTGKVQGDSRFGDIRFGAKTLGSYLAYGYYPSTFSTTGGDVNLNSSNLYSIGTTTDLYSVLLHETGHALGLGHSSATRAVMRGTVAQVFPGLFADDIAGIQAVYGARLADGYDSMSSNDTLPTATPVALTDGSLTLAADLTTTADVDGYKITVPSGSTGTATVSVDARGISLLAPKVSVYNASGQLVATATAGTAYGTVATVTLTGLTAGESYTVVADGATTDAFGMGAYQLSIQFGGFAAALTTTTTTTASTTTTSTSTTGGGGAMLADDCDECGGHDHADGASGWAWHFGPAVAITPPAVFVGSWNEAASPRPGRGSHRDDFVIPVDVDQPPARSAAPVSATASHGATRDDLNLGSESERVARV